MQKLIQDRSGTADQSEERMVYLITSREYLVTDISKILSLISYYNINKNGISYRLRPYMLNVTLKHLEKMLDHFFMNSE